MSKQFKMTFNPMATAVRKGIVAITYCFEADSLTQAEQQAEANLTAEGYSRKDFRRNIESHCSLLDSAPKIETNSTSDSKPAKEVVETETTKTIEAEKVVEVAAAEVNTVDDDEDPFAQFMPKPWTVESLNERLELLVPGERLVIDDLPDDIYHGCSGVSTSKLKMFIECPKKYKAHYIDCIIPRTEKAYFDMGKAIHTLTLEPWLFNASYVEQAEDIKVRNGKKWDAFKATADANGQVVLTRAQWAEMPIMRQSLENEPTALALTSGGISEQSYFMRDVETGLIVKCRPDYKIGDLIIDLKSAASADPKDIRYKFKKLGYHIQDALYSEVSEAKEFAFLVVESSAPFVWVGPVAFEEPAKRLGYLKYRKALRDLKQCMDSNMWPGYTDEMVTIELNKFESDELEALETEQALAEYNNQSRAA